MYGQGLESLLSAMRRTPVATGNGGDGGTRERAAGAASEQGEPRVAEHLGHVGEELRTLLPVDQPVIEREPELRDPARLDPLLRSRTDDPRHPAHRPEGEDARLPRVQDR